MGRRADGSEPEQEALLADSIGLALIVVLETLDPAERLAFVLHDMFAMPFDELAPIVGRTSAAARQLASRARRRVQGATTASQTDVTRQREIVDAFLAASREGDFEALLAVLDPDVVLRLDRGAVPVGASMVVRGASAVAGLGFRFSGASVNGVPGVAVTRHGRPASIVSFTIKGGKIVAIDVLADPARVRRLDLEELLN
jgi:RNA polymerase sigma-70 factor (ECF subfamily)